MSVSFSYTLSPPASIDSSTATHAGASVPPAGEASFPVTPAPAADRSATEAFYAGAVPALRDAQARLMEVLTAWKDAIGDVEKHKENPGKVAKGQGKAARMMAANKAAEESESEESDA